MNELNFISSYSSIFRVSSPAPWCPPSWKWEWEDCQSRIHAQDRLLSNPKSGALAPHFKPTANSLQKNAGDLSHEPPLVSGSRNTDCSQVVLSLKREPETNGSHSLQNLQTMEEEEEWFPHKLCWYCLISTFIFLTQVKPQTLLK
jgi:hypothetical protein